MASDLRKAINVIQSIENGVLTINHLVDAFTDVRDEERASCIRKLREYAEQHGPLSEEYQWMMMASRMIER